MGQKVCAISKNLRARDADDCTTCNKLGTSGNKLTRMRSNVLRRHSRRRDGRAQLRRTHHASWEKHINGETMNTKETQILRPERRARYVLVTHEPKSDVAELAMLREQLNNAIS